MKKERLGDIMAIPKIDFIEKPFSDDFFDYNYEEHRYIPLVSAIKNTAYIDLEVVWKSEENAQAYLDLLSSVVYDVILSRIDDTKYKVHMLYYLSHSIEMRILLMDLFKDTAWYNQRDGGFMLAYNSGANLNQGKLIEFGIDKAISSIAHQKLKNSKLGVRVLQYNINILEYFDTFDELKIYLVDNGYITQEQSDEADELCKIPKSYKYRLTQNYKGQYVFEDLLTYDKIVSKMKIYDNVNGDW